MLLLLLLLLLLVLLLLRVLLLLLLLRLPSQVQELSSAPYSRKLNLCSSLKDRPPVSRQLRQQANSHLCIFEQKKLSGLYWQLAASR